MLDQIAQKETKIREGRRQIIEISEGCMLIKPKNSIPVAKSILKVEANVCLIIDRWPLEEQIIDTTQKRGTQSK